MEFELMYKAGASVVTAVVLGGVGLAFYRGIREGLEQNRAARLQQAQREQLARTRSQAGQACVYIDPEQTAAAAADSGRPADAFPFARPSAGAGLPPLTETELDLLRRIGLGVDVTDAADAARLSRLDVRFPRLLHIGKATDGSGAYFHCRVRLWAWSLLQQPASGPSCIDVAALDKRCAA